MRIHKQAIKLREAIYRVFSAVARSDAADREDVELIEEFAIEAMNLRRLVSARGAFRWDWKPERGGLLRYVLYPIAQSATDLLTSEKLKKVRLCAASTCAWLFLDESRNHSRLWCDMNVCGNRQKAKRHHERQK